MPRDVPARPDARVREQGAHTGEILFRFLRVNLVFDFVVFQGNSEKTDAVDAAGGRARGGVVHAELKPKKVAKIDEQEQGERGEEDAAEDMAERVRGVSKVGWGRSHKFRIVDVNGCGTVQLYQHGDGDALITVIKVAVAAQIGAMLDGIARVVLEDAPLFAEDDTRNQAFFLAAQQ